MLSLFGMDEEKITDMVNTSTTLVGRAGYRQYLMLVLPLIISTLTTPLLGAVDTALVGHYSDPALVGGVAVGAVIFNTLYWLLGFLRVSTTAWSAQAQNDADALMMSLLRPLVIATVFGLLLVALQKPIFTEAMALISPSDTVQGYASEYFFILIWGAPFTLMNYVLLGWLMGRKCIRSVLVNQISINLLNIAIALILVIGFSAGVRGVAYATLVAQVSGTLLGFWLVKRSKLLTATPRWRQGLLERSAYRQMFLVNSDLMIRTVCLLVVTNQFVAIGASQGNDTLAANMILFQIHYLMCYMFDGFANASSIYSGQAKGAQDNQRLKQTIHYSAISCLWMSALIAAGWWIGDTKIIHLFTQQPAVIALAHQYAPWLILFPFCASVGLVFYGVFTGITWTKPVRNSMLLALILWLSCTSLLVDSYGNHGLWLSYLLFSAGRSLFLLGWLPGLRRMNFLVSG